MKRWCHPLALAALCAFGSAARADTDTDTDAPADACLAAVRGGLGGDACERLAAQLPLLDAAPARQRFRAHAALALDDAALGRPAAALAQHVAALAAAESAGSADLQSAALDALAQHLRRTGQGRLAVFFGRQAQGRIEAARADPATEAQAADAGFAADKPGVYRRVAEWLAEDGRIDEALQTLRLLKEQEFLDYVQRDAGLLDASVITGLSAAEHGLDQRWQATRERLAAAATEQPLPRGSDPAAAPDDLRTAGRQAAREADWRADMLGWLQELSAAPPPAAARGEASPPGGTAPALPPVPAGELWLSAITGGQVLTLVFEAGSSREVLRLAWDAGAVANDVGALLSALGRREAALPLLQALYRRIGAPIDAAAQRAGARRVVLQLDGALRYLPLAALHDGRRYLGESYSFEQRVRGIERPGDALAGGTAPAQMLAVGVTRESAGFKPLRGVAEEVCGIVAGPVHGLAAADAGCAPGGLARGVVRGEAWLNEQFTAKRLALAASPGRSGGPALLHVGTHFELRPGHMGRSWLLLGDGARLTLDELSRISFAGNALVTLSACETGLGGAADATGQEVDGLNTLMVRRGAAAVLASLWRVEDDSTSQLMRHFYRELALPGATPAEALSRAQQALRKPGGAWAAPFHWAGFYVIGRSLR